MSPSLACVGIDVSKATLDVHLLATDTSLTVPNSDDGVAAIVARLDPTHPACIVLEATGPYHLQAVRSLLAAGFPVAVVNPAQIAAFRRAKHQFTKTDRTDARLLARFALLHQPRPTWVPSPGQMALAELVARRRDLVHMLVQEKNRRAVLGGRAKVSAETIIVALSGELRAIEQEIAAQVAADAALQALDRQVRTVPGIGATIASTVLADLPELGVIPAKALSALAGVAPHLQQSGQHKGQARIQGGRNQVRTVLYLAVLTACRKEGVIKHHRDRLLERGKPMKVAMIATARWLLGLLHVMARDGLAWDQLHVVTSWTPPLAA